VNAFRTERAAAPAGDRMQASRLDIRKTQDHRRRANTFNDFSAVEKRPLHHAVVNARSAYRIRLPQFPGFANRRCFSGGTSNILVEKTVSQRTRSARLYSSGRVALDPDQITEVEQFRELKFSSPTMVLPMRFGYRPTNARLAKNQLSRPERAT